MIIKRRRIAAREAELVELKQELESTRLHLRALGHSGLRAAERADVRLHDLLAANARTLSEVERNVAVPEHAPWSLARWLDWQPQTLPRTRELRVGTFSEERSGETLAVPLVAPLIGSGRALVLASEGEQEHATGIGLLQSLVMRTAATFPQQARYTLLDPSGNGVAFPMARRLDNAAVSVGDIRRELDDVLLDIQRITTTYLDAARTSFDQLPEGMRVGESYHFVVAADFPNGYDLRAAEALQLIARNGPRAGVYLILHLHRDHLREGLAGYDRYAVENPWLIEMGAQEISIGGTPGTVTYDDAPAAAIQDLVFQRLRAMPRRDRSIAWDELAPREWWQERADDRIGAPIGRHGAAESLDVWFGTDPEQLRSCVHGVLGAATGAGKSTLLHNLITALAVRYRPDDLRFFLIDGKYGVEFRPYRTLPHAEVVSLHTSPVMARSVLDDLVGEMARRNAIFVEHRVADLSAYRAAGQPGGNLPRLMLVIDEYQQLFDGDREGEASANLLRISQQGRSAGIHMLLSSQRLDPGQMLHRNEIFGNVHLRMAMQLAQSDTAALTEFGPSGRRLIALTCDRAGRLVVNDRAGDDTANVAGKAALIDPASRDRLVATLAEKAARELDAEARGRTIVLDGAAAPALVDNPHAKTLVGLRRWPDAAELEALARTDERDGGFGVADWLAGEHPVPLLLGQQFTVRGQAMVALRRRTAEHLLVVGEHEPARVGMLAGAVLGAALARPPHDLQLLICDRSATGTTWAGVLPTLAEQLAAAGFLARCDGLGDDPTAVIEGIAATIADRRTRGDSERQPTVLLVLNELDRFTELQRIPDEFGSVESPLGTELRQVLAHGPMVGVHVVLGVSTLSALRTVLSDRTVQHDLRHRVALEMAEDDSFVLVRSARAASLADDTVGPVPALLFDAHRQSSLRFTPYTSEPDLSAEGVGAPLVRQLAEVLAPLKARVS